MRAHEHQRALRHHQHHMHEADQMPQCRHHGMKPESIDDRETEEIAMIAAQAIREGFAKRHFFAEEETAPLVLHAQDDDQHQRDSKLRRPAGQVLGDGIIEKERLQIMQDDEDEIDRQSPDVDRAQLVGIVAFAIAPLGISDSRPNEQLMRSEAQPGGQLPPSCLLGQLPLVDESIFWVGDDLELAQRPAHGHDCHTQQHGEYDAAVDYLLVAQSE